MTADKCRPVVVDGEVIRVHGGEPMGPESLAAFAEVVRAAKRRMDARSCPDCEQGKHANCTGQAWDNYIDDFTVCPCHQAGHGDPS